MEQRQPNSRRLVWLVIGAAVVVFIVISIILYVLFGTPKQESSTTVSSQSTTSDNTVPTAQDVKQNISDLDDALRQSREDKKSADAALDDEKNQIKVGE